ncbi:hypothetical protein C0J52_23942 [Blattella germanica]|nr:hypothetical protein C0J52_23942 [Blattella germanica]
MEMLENECTMSITGFYTRTFHHTKLLPHHDLVLQMFLIVAEELYYDIMHYVVIVVIGVYGEVKEYTAELRGKICVLSEEDIYIDKHLSSGACGYTISSRLVSYCKLKERFDSTHIFVICWMNQLFVGLRAQGPRSTGSITPRQGQRAHGPRSNRSTTSCRFGERIKEQKNNSAPISPCTRPPDACIGNSVDVAQDIEICIPKYVQPERPESFAPVRKYYKPVATMEDNTIYKMSYPGIDPETAAGCRGDLKRLEDNIHSAGKFSSDTTQRTQYIRSLIAASIHQNPAYEVYEEVGCVSSDGSTRRADIIIIDQLKDKCVILDLTVHFEMHEQQPQEMGIESSSEEEDDGEGQEEQSLISWMIRGSFNYTSRYLCCVHLLLKNVEIRSKKKLVSTRTKS